MSMSITKEKSIIASILNQDNGETTIMVHGKFQDYHVVEIVGAIREKGCNNPTIERAIDIMRHDKALASAGSDFYDMRNRIFKYRKIAFYAYSPNFKMLMAQDREFGFYVHISPGGSNNKICIDDIQKSSPFNISDYILCIYNVVSDPPDRKVYIPKFSLYRYIPTA